MKKVDEITAELEQGVQDVLQSDKYRGFLEMMSRFYNYSACNCILIMRQFPEATLVAGYNAWRDKFRRQVKKGEKAIRILAPCPHKKMTVDENGNEKEVRWTTFRATNVFDISQTEGEELPTICNRLTDSVEGYDGIIEKLNGISAVPIRFDRINVAGYYSPADKEIVLCEGMSEAQTVKTLVHEIAHSILHDKDTGTEKNADRNTRELQAESVAYTVCQYMGLDTSEYSFEYLASWSASDDTKELAKSLEVIRKTAKGIIDQITA